MKYGLCCLFFEQPIKFKKYTYSSVLQLFKEKGINEARNKIFDIWSNNVYTLQEAINFCKENDIGGYRIGSDLFPHLNRLVKNGLVEQKHLDEYTKKLISINSDGIILSMHPGQHVNIGSPNINVVQNSIIDLQDHFFISKPLGCKEINIHLGGAYNDKKSTIDRFICNIQKYLTKDELNLITLENDEINFNAFDTVSVCKEIGLRMTFDFHHQRCYELKHGIEKTSKEWFELARETWEGYNYQRVHISTPKYGYTTQLKSKTTS